MCVKIALMGNSNIKRYMYLLEFQALAKAKYGVLRCDFKKRINFRHASHLSD